MLNGLTFEILEFLEFSGLLLDDSILMVTKFRENRFTRLRNTRKANFYFGPASTLGETSGGFKGGLPTKNGQYNLYGCTLCNITIA